MDFYFFSCSLTGTSKFSLPPAPPGAVAGVIKVVCIGTEELGGKFLLLFFCWHKRNKWVQPTQPKTQAFCQINEKNAIPLVLIVQTKEEKK